MIVEQHSGGRHGPTYSVWITPQEYRHELLPAAPGYQEALAVRLGAEASLRAEEIADVRPGHVVRGRAEVTPDGSTPTSSKDVIEGWFLRVPDRKDTTGDSEGGRYGRAVLPNELKTDIDRFTRDRNIAPKDRLLGVKKRQVQRYVERTRTRTAEETGNEDWLKFSTHDLRRFFAQTCLQREELNPRTVMYVGGWSSMEALRPYLNAPEEGEILSEFSNVFS